MNNYRGITLCPTISILFEYCLLHKYESHMDTSDVQFGFKKNLGCSHALFALRQCVNYFISHGSSAFMAALGAKKHSIECIMLNLYIDSVILLYHYKCK